MLGLRNSIENASTPEELAAAIAAAGSGSRWTVSSLGEVAAFFGQAVSTTKGWSQEGMPNAGDGWSLPAIVRWRIARLSGDDLSTVRKRQEVELNAITIEQKRLELAKERGELVELADVELWVAQALISTRVVFMSQPETLAIAMPPEHRDFIRAESDRICRAALAMLRRKLDGEELDKELATGDVADDDYEPKKRNPTDDDAG